MSSIRTSYWRRFCPLQQRYLRLIHTAVLAWRFALFGKLCTHRAVEKSKASPQNSWHRLTLPMRFPDRLSQQTTPTKGRCDETRETDLRRAYEGGQRGQHS